MKTIITEKAIGTFFNINNKEYVKSIKELRKNKNYFSSSIKAVLIETPYCKGVLISAERSDLWDGVHSHTEYINRKNNIAFKNY